MGEDPEPLRLDGLDDEGSVLDNVAPSAPTVTMVELRNRLARCLIRGAAVERPVGTAAGRLLGLRWSRTV